MATTRTAGVGVLFGVEHVVDAIEWITARRADLLAEYLQLGAVLESVRRAAAAADPDAPAVAADPLARRPRARRRRQGLPDTDERTVDARPAMAADDDA